MIHRFTLVLLAFFVVGAGVSQAQSARGDHWAADFHYGLTENDFNLGLGIKSSSFAMYLNTSAAVDLFSKESVAPGAQAGTNNTFTMYETIRAGINLETDMVGGIGRLYTGFGPIAVFPGTLSSQTVAFGGYGLFGFDFWLPDVASSYFFELGGNLTNAMADKLPGSPSLQYGFTIDTGYRYHF